MEAEAEVVVEADGHTQVVSRTDIRGNQGHCGRG